MFTHRIHVYYSPQRVTCLAALSDGRLAFGSEDKMVRLWDLSTGLCVKVLGGHTDVRADIVYVYVHIYNICPCALLPHCLILLLTN